MIARTDYYQIDAQPQLGAANEIGDDATDLPLLTLLGRALNQAGTSVCITDLSGRIAWANQAYVRLTGLSREDVLGTTVFPLLGASASSPLRFVKASAAECEEFWRRERSYTRPDGTTYITDELVAPLFDAQGQVSHFVVSMHDVTSSKEALKQQRLLNNHDVLTGLACRSHITELGPAAIEAARRSGQTLAMLFIDLDGFKAINDGYGHHIGDLVLKAIGARLQSAVRSSDTLARFGGDEFVILLPTISHRTVAKRLANKIVKLAGEPFAVGTERHRLSASVGVAFYPEDGTGFDSLLISADRAMYRAKRDGGNQVCLARGGASSLALPGP